MTQETIKSKKSLVKKVTFKSVVGKPEMEVVEVPTTEDPTKTEKKLRAIKKTYARIIGTVTDIRLVATDYGDSVRFIGNFRGINLITGEQFDGGELFLPPVAEVYLHNHIKGLGENFAGIDFAFDIGVKPANSNVGYEYTVQPLIERDEASDPLSKLMLTLPSLPLLLEASKSEPEKPAKK